MLHPNKDTFTKEVTQRKGVTVIDFYADWCGPCKVLSPLMEELDRENKDRDVAYAKVNVDENQELAAAFGVMSIPTVVFLKDGKVAAKKIGVQEKQDYLKAVESAKSFDPANVKRDVTVFTTPTCPYCHMAKDYLKSRNIPFKDVDVSKDQTMAREMINKSGEMGVPQLWIGEEVVIGFNKPAIDMALNL
jgi:thioredoxin 1